MVQRGALDQVGTLTRPPRRLTRSPVASLRHNPPIASRSCTRPRSLRLEFGWPLWAPSQIAANIWLAPFAFATNDLSDLNNNSP